MVPRALDSARFRPVPSMTGPEVAASAGIDYELARRIWRSLGLPDVPEDTVYFDEDDADALRSVARVVERGIPMSDVVRVTRTYGRALSVVADAEARVFARHVVQPLLEDGRDLRDIEEQVDPLVQWLLAESAALLVHAHRRHLRNVIDGLTIAEDDRGVEDAAVGFIDMSGFSRASDRLEPDELADLVERFETLAIERSADSGVRVVKVIGDAVMLVCPRPRDLITAIEHIIVESDRDDALLAVRAGADFGPVTPVAGDYYGRAVNVASRITAFARPGALVGSEELLRALDDDDVDVSRIGSPRLKGVGRVRLYKFRLAT